MAIMNKIVLASAALVAFTNAVPLQVRNPVTDMVTETTWTTVDVDVTVWVDQNGQPYSTETGAPYAPAATTAPSAPSQPTPSAQPSSSSPAASPNAGGSFYQAPSPSTTPAPAAPAATTTTTTPAAYQAQPQATSSAAAAPAPSPSTSGAGSYSGGGSSTGTCQGQSNSCSGDITYYEGGMGACGDMVNTDSDMYIALPVEFMEAAGSAWPNPLCGKTVTIYNPDTKNTVQATVKDKCMGCSGRSIDLTNAVFKAIAPSCDGRCSGFDWWFN